MTDAGDKRKYYQWSKEDLEKALIAYEKKEMSLNKIAKTYSIPKPTILRHAMKKNKIAIDAEIQKGRPAVFVHDIENKLTQHILDLEKYMFGLTINNIRSLAFQIAERHNILNNFNKEKRMAGKGWFYNFMKRHPELSVRQPENTSLNRIKGFNRKNVYGFFDLLEKIIDENSLAPTNIFNVDESGFSTVQKKAQKIVGLKGKKQVGAATSGERGVNTTAVCCASVSGQFVPPMLIFKRKRQNPELANGAPLGSIVTVSESGYINSTLFVEWLKHFIKNVKPTLENKVLLLLDGHTTHSKNLDALYLAKANGIIMLQLPGHTTNRIQPLDVSFFKPLSTYYIQSTEKWLRSNPGRQVTQYQVAKLFGEAYERAAMIGNIVNGFKASGVRPVNRHVFPVHMFEIADSLLNDDTLNSSNESISVLQNYTDSGKQNDPHHKEIEGYEEDNKSEIEKQSIITSAEIHDQPSTSVAETMKILSPLPKQSQKRKNTIQEAVEITSSPYKNQLEEKAKKQKKTKKVKKEKVVRPKRDQRASKENKIKATVKGKGKYSKKKRSPSITSSDDSENNDVIMQLDVDDETDDEMDNICAKCNRYYYDKKGPKVDWIQCVRCQRWLHETCTSNPDICDSCLH